VRQAGCWKKSGVVEVVSSLERDGRPVFRDLRWGVYVVLEASNDYAADCFTTNVDERLARPIRENAVFWFD